MEVVDIVKRAFLDALKAIYFDQGGIWLSAVDYYIAAGEALLNAADRGSSIPDLKRKARLYCDRAEFLRKSLDERTEIQPTDGVDTVRSEDWDTLDDAFENCDVATPETVLDADCALTPGDELLHDYVVIYNSAINGRECLNDCAANDAPAVMNARGMVLLTRRLFASALEADSKGKVEDAFLLYMSAVEETISEQKRDTKMNDSSFKTPKEKEVDQKMRILASQAIERIETIKEEITSRARR